MSRRRLRRSSRYGSKILSGKVGTHLAEGITTGVADTGVGVLQSGHNQGKNLIKLADYNVMAILRDSKDGHKGSVTIALSNRRHYAGDPRKSGLQNSLATKLIGKTVHTSLTSQVVKIVLFGFELNSN